MIDGIELEGAEWEPKHKWDESIENSGKGATLIKKLKAQGVYKKGMTYAEAFTHRVPHMVARHYGKDPKPVYQCMNFVTAIFTEYAHFYELELNIRSDRADKLKEHKKIAQIPHIRVLGKIFMEGLRMMNLVEVSGVRSVTTLWLGKHIIITNHSRIFLGTSYR